MTHRKTRLSTLDRRTQTTTFRLRTGHCGLGKHLKRLGLPDSAHCECGSEEQTPEHILQTCPHLKTARQQFWSEGTKVGTKLWGQAAELQRTADFLTATGFSTVITWKAERTQGKGIKKYGRKKLLVDCLTSSNRLVYLRDGSAQTI